MLFYEAHGNVVELSELELLKIGLSAAKLNLFFD